MQLTHLDNSMPISTIAVTVDKKRWFFEQSLEESFYRFVNHSNQIWTLFGQWYSVILFGSVE